MDAPKIKNARTLTRREVLKTAAGTGLILLLPMLPEQALAADQWVVAGKVSQFLLYQPQRVALANGAVLYITRLNSKKVLAVSAKCTHRGCEIGWDKTSHLFICPCHGAVFGSSGVNVHGTRRSPEEKLPSLPSVPVRQKAGQVQVNLAAVPASDVTPGRNA